MADQFPKEKLRSASLKALNSVAFVAVLIATVTFTAGLDPPGTFNQGGEQAGMAVVAHKASFEIFSIFNDLALFASLFLVLVISSFNLVEDTALEVLLGISTVVMWVAVICMTAARRVLLPQGHWTWLWTVATGGSLILIAAGLLILVHAKLMQKFGPISRFRRIDFSFPGPRNPR